MSSIYTSTEPSVSTFNTQRYAPQLVEGVDSVLIIGSGGLSIGQAGEFDYSGSQAIKALKEAKKKTILINPNIATNQTSHSLADKIYYLPVTPEYISYIIERERPDAILLTFGGQTGLNCGVALDRMGVLKKYNIKVLGTPIKTLETTEDRELFAQALQEINVPIAKSFACETLEETLKAAEEVQYPVIVRSAYALGGLGSGFASNAHELRELASQSLSLSPQILVEKSLKGWKEIEYEVVRDRVGNCITVCNMENFDPLGIHTGDSIVFAPSQTLSDEEFHMLRTAAIKIIRHLGVVGECNVQYALQPDGLDYRVIEVNARLSRSSALASKATGYPLAYTAAKIALGYTLPELPNPVTKTTVANFEPSLDYIVAKIPKWDLSKFQHVNRDIGSAMKSVGEVMAIGRNFEEAYQKALREVDPSLLGFQGSDEFGDDLDNALSVATDRRSLAIGQALLHEGYTVDRVHELTHIDKWFLHKCMNIVRMYKELESVTSKDALDKDLLQKAKKLGFSDKQIAVSVSRGISSKIGELEIRTLRKSYGIVPFVKKIDTLAAEFPANTNYLYTTYNATKNDVDFTDKGMLVLGSGVYRIGSSVEFDWCAVNTAKTLRAEGKKTVMINYNPETVSTDFDEVDRLYFEELSYERVMDIYELEHSEGCVISVGGQLPQNIALTLHQTGCNVLGTSPVDIDNAESRHKFSAILDSIKVGQPEWSELKSVDEAINFANKVNYPVLIRPSYVLSGAAMNVVNSEHELEEKLTMASDVSPDHPVVMSKFIEGAEEIDVDGVGYKGQLLVHAISEHVENAGVHSGDATLVLPPQNLSEDVKLALKDIAVLVVKAFNITGPFNMQVIKHGDDLKVIECNIRASRSFPFVSKVLGRNFIETSVKAFLGGDKVPAPVDLMTNRKYDYVATKVPQFSFTRLAGADPFLGVEMASTGEVAAFGTNPLESYWTAMQATMHFHVPLPPSGILFGGDLTKPLLGQVAKTLSTLGYHFYVVDEASKKYLQNYIQPQQEVQVIAFPKNDKRKLREMFQEHDIKTVFNLASKRASDVEDPDYIMRRNAIDFAIPLFTEPRTSLLFARALKEKVAEKVKVLESTDVIVPPEVRCWEEYLGYKA
ncbi:ZYBA0S06-05204g1_1 [Zygosaccharomyces bailii CLIB 213]|uniref:Carbamoyl phosphate synthase arginine-specific large chain n=1 Tax=Zygosaccharomyces bailii (strain CLIB 213 / ATCC 58445 / CBS 680 / BCRC 21525 / NBRC 1098 / NCYC 1416 / NRRL Y-2227) TaxID=1333698 RepID=A0A8J2X1T2_ZYGB2|nr:ZYBA0S06-05204g1_1 [Zygosaccharomyces bailii CLIB 213]